MIDRERVHREREGKGALVLPGAPYGKSEGSVIKRQKGKHKS